MRPSRLRDAAVALIAGAVLAASGCAGTPTRPAVAGPDGVQRVEVRVDGGAVDGGLARYSVPVGSTVELVVASDVADEVHLHGYDRSGFVTAGATATLRFVADVPGVFEVELEQAGTQLAQLEVS